VNGTYVPPLGHKTAVETLHATSLQLVNEGTLAVTEEITFPIRIVETLHATSLQEIGAITLLLDYDPAQIEITGVTIPVCEIQPWFEVQGSILSIGWMSLDPIHLETDEPLFLIHARLTDAFRSSHFTSQIPDFTSEISHLKSEISFTLNDSPLSELADGDGNVLEGVKLAMPSGANGKTAKLQNGKMEIVSVYPNPAKDVVHLEISSEDETTVNIEIFNMPGKKVLKPESMIIIPGLNIKSMDVSMLPCGVYMMKVTMDERTEIRKVLVNR
jgi:hypothetical protein